MSSVGIAESSPPGSRSQHAGWLRLFTVSVVKINHRVSASQAGMVLLDVLSERLVFTDYTFEKRMSTLPHSRWLSV